MYVYIYIYVNVHTCIRQKKDGGAARASRISLDFRDFTQGVLQHMQNVWSTKKNKNSLAELQTHRSVRGEEE